MVQHHLMCTTYIICVKGIIKVTNNNEHECRIWNSINTRQLLNINFNLGHSDKDVNLR